MTSLIYAAKLPKNLQTPWRNGVGGGVEAAQLTSVCVTPGGKLMWISGPIATQTEPYGQVFVLSPHFLACAQFPASTLTIPGPCKPRSIPRQ